MDDKDKRLLSRSKVVPVKPVVVETTADSKINNEVKIQSLIDAHIIYSGQVSGRQYEWQKSGSIVNVDEQDVSDLLSKHGKKSCCGREPNKFFQLAT
mgnify:CR=1 FL=1